MLYHQDAPPILFHSLSAQTTSNFIVGAILRFSLHFRMLCHLFGAVSSMDCANVGLQGIVSDYQIATATMLLTTFARDST